MSRKRTEVVAPDASFDLNAVAEHMATLATPAPQPPRSEAPLAAGEVENVRLLRFGGPALAWELEQQLLHAERVVAAVRSPSTAASEAPPDWALELQAPTPAREPSPEQKSTSSAIAGLALASAALGFMALSCATALIVWSAVADRDDLWSIGLPLAPGGLVGIILALTLRVLGRQSVAPDRPPTEAAMPAHAPHGHALPRPHFELAPARSPFGASRPMTPHALRQLSGELDRIAANLAQTR